MAGDRAPVVDRELFPSNSISNKEPKKEERKKLAPVVSCKVKTQKKSIGKRIFQALLGDDTKSVGGYVLHDVLIPAAKAMITDMVGGGIEMLVYGERQGRRTYRDRGTSYVNYDKASYRSDRERDREKGRDIPRTARARHDFDDVVIESRGEAEAVISHLVDLCYDYGQATVADFYDLVDITGNFTDTKWGWTDLRGATISRVRDGFVINLPKPKQVD